ncbi:MAG: hypothetical protein JKY43_07585, partial [Phycisphaerales bacterium]|nr:hypothetical protein [Phycisphaerales bacterium]
MKKEVGQLGWGGWIVVGGVVLVLVGVFGVVVFGAASVVDFDSIGEGVGLILDRGVGLLVQTMLIAGGIGFLAMVLGVPMGRVLMGRDRRWLWGIALVPIWMPSYAMYGAMNLARAPDTIVGRWLISYATSDVGGDGMGGFYVNRHLMQRKFVFVVYCSNENGRLQIQKNCTCS